MLSKQNMSDLPFGKIIGKMIAGVFAALVIYSSVGYNDSGVSLRLQQPMIGHTWIKEEGFYGKLPFVSKERPYNQKGTISSTDDPEIIEASSISSPPQALQFADSYEMQFEWTMRYELSTDDDDLEAMHKSVKSERNLLGNTLKPFGNTLVTDSVNQMLGGNFAQGGRNSLRTLIDNQSQNGMYQTKVEKVKVGRKEGKGSNDTTGSTNMEDLEITKVTYLTDPLTNKRLRTPLSIAQYDIKIVPNSITLNQTKPLGRLVTYIDTKQLNIEKQIEQDEKQKILAKETHTQKLQGEKNLVMRTNDLNIKKQEAIIGMERQVEEAKLQAEKETVERQKVADLAIIDKKRELQIAKDNEGIQRANAIAAKHQGEALRQVGFAEAEVTQKKYKAIDPKILAMEVDKAKALALYKSNMTVNMPYLYQQGGGEGGSSTSSNIDIMSSLKIMESLSSPAANTPTK